MLPIISASFFGSGNGYMNATETAVNYLSAQAIKIREIFEWANIPAGGETPEVSGGENAQKADAKQAGVPEQ